MLKILALLAVAVLGLQAAEKESDAARRLTEAGNVFGEVMQVPDKAIPQELLERAQCVVVIPGMKKAAFVIGGKYGRGYASCRRENGVGWSGPAGVRIEGGTFGLQIGGAESDVVMLVLNRRGMEKLLTSKFTLGADATVAAGPVGRSSAAQTDALMHAEILTWSRSRGAFAGLALDGATLRPDSDANKELYGREAENKEILSGTLAAPQVSRAFTSTLNKYSSRK
jgi:lipid-binding SYLF domain-containing protein